MLVKKKHIPTRLLSVNAEVEATPIPVNMVAFQVATFAFRLKLKNALSQEKVSVRKAASGV